jgi:hypothetical protein
MALLERTDTASANSEGLRSRAKDGSGGLASRMNSAQVDIIFSVLLIVAAALVFIFLRFGYVYEYADSFRLIVLYDRTTPVSPLYVNNEWGLLARMGISGVLFGVIIPILLCASAAFLAAGTGRSR